MLHVLERTMKNTVPSALVVVCAALACAENGPEPEARATLARILRDSIGGASDPKVAFIIDANHRDAHLYVHLDTSAFPNMSDSAFALRARDIARLSLRHYEKADDLDSVTVASRENLQPGVARIHHRSTFSIAQLRTPVPR
jgi:hypothetical protein